MALHIATEGMARIYLDPEYADLEIVCEEKVFKVHRAVVCAASPVMAAQCKNGSKHDGVTRVQAINFEEHVMDMMIQFMYHGAYTLDPKDSIEAANDAQSSLTESVAEPESTGYPSAFESMLAHVQVSNIATVYELPLLETLARENFRAMLDTEPILKPEEIIEIAALVYAHAPLLSDKLVEMVLKSPDKYLGDSGFVEAIVMVKEFHKFAMDILAYMPFLQAQTRQDEKQRIEELQHCQAKNSELEGKLAAANVASSLAIAEQGKKDKVYDNLVEQLKLSNRRLEKQQTDSAAAAKARLEDAVAKADAQLGKAHAEIRELKADVNRLKAVHATSQLQVKDSQRCIGALQQQVDESSKSLSTALVAPQPNLNEWRARIKQADKDAALQRSIVKQLVEFNEITQCRQCDYYNGEDGEDFCYYLERYGDGYVARCMNCTTRHYGS